MLLFFPSAEINRTANQRGNPHNNHRNIRICIQHIQNLPPRRAGGGSGRTALGNYAGKGHAAVDPDVIPLGSIVYIEGYGYAICDDIGGAIQGYVIDVGVDSLEQAYQWGSRDNITVYLIS